MLTAYCLCAELPTVVSRVRILVVRHVRELRKPSGTVRIAALAIPALEIVDYRDEPGDATPAWLAGSDSVRDGAQARSPERIAEEIAARPGGCLLFPTGREAKELAELPQTLIVLDGTWRQTRRMYQRISGLAALPALRLPEAATPMRRLREAHGAQRSSLEAIGEAVTALGDEAGGAALLALHARFVERSLRARGRPI